MSKSVHVVARSNGAACLHCGRSVEFKMPIAVDDFVALCGKPREPAFLGFPASEGVTCVTCLQELGRIVQNNAHANLQRSAELRKALEAAETKCLRIEAERDGFKTALENREAELAREREARKVEREALEADLEGAYTERDAARADVERLKTLAYIGEHHFPENTYKARLDELVPKHRELEAEVERLRAQLEPVAKLDAEALARIILPYFEHEPLFQQQIAKEKAERVAQAYARAMLTPDALEAFRRGYDAQQMAPSGACGASFGDRVRAGMRAALDHAGLHVAAEPEATKKASIIDQVMLARELHRRFQTAAHPDDCPAFDELTDKERTWWMGHAHELLTPRVDAEPDAGVNVCMQCYAEMKQGEVPVAGRACPVPIRLPCPSCGELHVDEGEFATKEHHTHACQHCGMTWRPAVVPTVGVRFLPGFKNEAAAARSPAEVG